MGFIVSIDGRCTEDIVERGRILDVAVDLRIGSPYFGKHTAIELDDKSRCLLYIPTGFAHGFCTLEKNTIIAYKVNGPYRPDLERGLYWHDPKLAIDWPFDPPQVTISERDTQNPSLDELPNYFFYDNHHRVLNRNTI